MRNTKKKGGFSTSMTGRNALPYSWGNGSVITPSSAYMRAVADLVQDPMAFYFHARATYYAEKYMLNTMYDLFDLSRRAENGGISKQVTHALQDAVEDAAAQPYQLLGIWDGYDTHTGLPSLRPTARPCHP